MKKINGIVAILAFLAALPLAAQQRYLLGTDPHKVKQVCSRHDLVPVSQLWGSGANGVFVVTSPGPVNTSALALDTDVNTIEAVQPASVPENLSGNPAHLQQSTTGILDQIHGGFLVSFFGSSVPSFYVDQPALTRVNLPLARSTTSLTGLGVTVAVIDTGVDTLHPALINVLVPGFDFTRNIPGGTELFDISLTAMKKLGQSTTGILDGGGFSVINGSTALLAQSTTGILDGDPDFGHGTMTAGLVHVVAPDAKIMPLKAFLTDGTSDSANIVRAIYYAADHGANVISMSFEMVTPSPAIQQAVEYAVGKGITVVAASGNDGQRISVYPAALNDVIGVGSTNNLDQRSLFSNFDSSGVFVGAPGEAVITTFPLGNYAVGWGTSFSTPLVAGEAALILQGLPRATSNQVGGNISRAFQVVGMGHGRVDVSRGVQGLSATKSSSGPPARH